MVQLPGHEGRQGHGTHQGQGHDALVLEPGVLLPLLQQHLQRAQGEGQQGDAGPVDARQGRRWLGFIRRQGPQGEQHRQDAEGQVDQEDPSPVQQVGEEAAQGGPQGRAGDDPQAEYRLGEALAVLGHGFKQDRLGFCQQPAPQQPLDDAPGHQPGQGRRQAAEHRGGGQAGHGEHEVAAAAIAVGQEGGEGQDHHVGDAVAGHHPAHLRQGGPQLRLDRGHGHVDDARVEHLQEGPERSSGDDRPVRGAQGRAGRDGGPCADSHLRCAPARWRRAPAAAASGRDAPAGDPARSAP